MPKLNKKTAEKVAEAESSDFEPLPAGAYHCRLVDVDGSREGPSGPYWSWEFDVLDEEHQNRKLWNNTSLSEAAHWKLAEAFAAFGVGTDTDTDELLGQVCKAIVTVRTIQAGARKGQLANQVDKLVEADEDFEAPEPAGVASGGSEDDIFS